MVTGELSAPGVRRSSNVDARITQWEKREWPRLKQTLLREFGWKVTRNPEWEEPGKAFYWCPREVFVLGRRPSDPPPEIEWDRTPLPADTAGQVAARLAKGCVLIDPAKGKSVEFVGAQLEAVNPNLNDDAGPEMKYVYEYRGKTFNFVTWGGFVNFMNSKGLLIKDSEIPSHIKRELHQFPYYCYQHNLGFPSIQLAEQHYRMSMRRPGPAYHLPVEEMQRPEQRDYSKLNPLAILGRSGGHEENTE